MDEMAENLGMNRSELVEYVFCNVLFRDNTADYERYDTLQKIVSDLDELNSAVIRSTHTGAESSELIIKDITEDGKGDNQ